MPPPILPLPYTHISRVHTTSRCGIRIESSVAYRTLVRERSVNRTLVYRSDLVPSGYFYRIIG